ncbi:hypothetical protein CNEO4_400007 [Clostridium neonatale]|nr:hypothetical protein CNEO4_400007 [Clostridium neonatale]CAI3670882.1 hypothetical protein CNEO4_430008 [Clostridium neonatale]
MNCTRRKADDAPFGHGFDTRRLHHETHENLNFGFSWVYLCFEEN